MTTEATPPSYSLTDLASLTGIPERTIRSYIGRGLLPPPDGRGRAATYGASHLESLLFLQRVRASVPYELPLAVLDKLLRYLPPEQIGRVARGEEDVKAVPVMQALDPSFLRRKRTDIDPIDAQDALHMVSESAPTLYASTPPRRVRTAAPPAFPPGKEGPENVTHSLAHGHAAKPAMPETWTTLQISPDVRLSMRGQAPTVARRLTALAERVRHWLGEEDSA
ncbi:MAG: MerR family transcriptional regulator [Planctomycetota bacterium]|nr:MerR family transcriptional regulator [Planctomycetota bacterium]